MKRWSGICCAIASAAAQKGLNDMGVAYEKGEGVMENDRESAKWFEKAAESGQAW